MPCETKIKHRYMARIGTPSLRETKTTASLRKAKSHSIGLPIPARGRNSNKGALVTD